MSVYSNEGAERTGGSIAETPMPTFSPSKPGENKGGDEGGDGGDAQMREGTEATEQVGRKEGRKVKKH